MITEAVATFLTCWAIVATIGWLSSIADHHAAKADTTALEDRYLKALDKERDAHTVTRERLYASWKDGHTIPAPPEPPPEPELALPDELAPIWEVWESQTGQAKMKAVLRQRVAEGRDVHSLLDEYGFLPPKE